MAERNVVLHFSTDVDSDLQAVFALNRVLANLPEHELEKFEIIGVARVDEGWSYRL